MISTMIIFYLLVVTKKKKINFNTFKMPLDFLQDIYNEKSSLKKAEFK